MDMQVRIREEEGALLKKFWLKHKAMTGDTQTAFCERLGMDQGQMQGWFRGKQPIPEGALLKIAAEININPADIRPSLRAKAMELIRLTQPAEAEDIRSRLSRLGENQLQDLSDFLDYLESKNKTY